MQVWGKHVSAQRTDADREHLLLAAPPGCPLSRPVRRPPHLQPSCWGDDRAAPAREGGLISLQT